MSKFYVNKTDLKAIERSGAKCVWLSTESDSHHDNPSYKEATLVDGLVLAKLETAKRALRKIADPSLRHKEPDKYTEVGCIMNIANEALVEIDGSAG